MFVYLAQLEAAIEAGSQPGDAAMHERQLTPTVTAAAPFQQQATCCMQHLNLHLLILILTYK